MNREDVEHNYDRLSRWYDMLGGFGEKRILLYGLRKLNAQPGERILDIGCGTGDALILMASNAGPAGRVYGLDVSPGMLKIAESKIRKSSLSDRILLLQGDASALPLAPGQMDAIFVSFTLELFDTFEIREVLRISKTVLKGAGRICIVYLSERERPGLVERLYAWMHRQWPTFIDCRPIQLHKALQEEGFRITDSGYLSMWGLVVEVVVAVCPG